MALWDNHCEPADIVNVYADLYGDGRIMDGFRHTMAINQPLQEVQRERELNAVCQRVKSTKERKVENDTGLTAVASVPLWLYHAAAIATRMKAEESGITLDCNGYGIWSDPDFEAYMRKHPKYQFLFYKEAPRNARIIVNETSLARPTSVPLIVSAA